MKNIAITFLMIFAGGLLAVSQTLVKTLEAEDASLTPPVKVKEITGYSGDKYVGDNNAGSSILFTDVEIAEAGTYEFVTYYSCMQFRSIAVKANDYIEQIATVVNTTSDWNAPPTATMSTYIYLQEGLNTIRVTPHNGNGPNIDKFEILTTDYVLPEPGDFPIILEAESAQLFGDLKVKPIDGSLLPLLSGGKYVGNFHLVARSYMKFEDIEIPEEGTYELRIHSMGASRPLAIKSNNYEVLTISTTTSPNWDDGPVATSSTLIYLNEGKNTLCFGLTIENGSNFDKFEIYQTDQVMEKPAIDDSAFPETCEGTDDYKIAFMGSSVCYGSNAEGAKGYAYMYTDLLKKRYQDESGKEWRATNISIGGNRTSDLLNRWSHLEYTCARYVMYGLSLANERAGTTTEVAFGTYQQGMLELIKKAEDEGRIPVMANNYPHSDYNAEDYNYLKRLNLIIHEWDVPSINTLGALDDGAGHWVEAYKSDGGHPNTEGHAEFFYAMVPSLFDALDAKKPLPQIVSGTSYKLGTASKEQIEFVPEEIVHPFTLSFEVKTASEGTIASFESASGKGYLKINSDGKMVYESPEGRQIVSTVSVTDNEWQRITLTHYYAWGISMLYVNNEKAGELSEKLVAGKMILGDVVNAPAEADYRQLFFWRSGMNAEEISAVCSGKMLKSSLEIYAPLGGEEPLANLAQSTNKLELTRLLSLTEQKSDNLLVYPNPVNRGEKLKMYTPGHVRIYSLSGMLVLEQKVKENSFVLTENLPAGTYLIQLVNGGKTNQTVLIIK